MDPFTLSSSPLHTAGDKTPPSTLKLIMSSSPALPSLSQLIAGKTALKTNQSPRSTNIGFSSARDLLGELNKEKGPSTPLFDDSLILESDIRVSDSNDEVSEPDCMKEQAPENVDKRPPPKGRCKSGTSSKSTISPHFSGSRLSPQQNEKPDGSDSKEKSKNPRKANQTKITNTKVRKPGICAVSEKKAKATDERQGLAKVGSKASKATKSSKSCEEARDLEVKDLTLSAEVEQGLGLVEAIKRRQSWTPVKNTSNRPDTPTEHAVACSALSPRESPNLGELNEPRFEMLLGAFACSKIDRIESAAFHVPRNQTGEAITKRRKVGVSQCYCCGG